jgi:HEAT repeat protein
LEFQGTESAMLAIRKVLDNSPFDHNRVVAAEILSTQKDPRVAGAISRLWAAPSWQARERATELIGALPGENPEIILLEFLNQNEPEVRLAATNLADPKFELACRRLLWGSVNDPSDAVRAASYLQLFKSTIPKFRDEARKGVSDDSAEVRLEVLKAFSAKPAEADRATLQQAVTDRSPNVRAAALRGFCKLTGPVTVDEIGNVIKDDHAEVQLALIALAVEKKIQLPAEAVSRLKASSDANVSAAAQALSGS